MKRVFFRALVTCFLIVALGGVSAFASSSHSHILPFKVWKQKKIDEAKAVVSELKREMRKVPNIKVDEDEDQMTLGHRMTQAELNLGVVRELSANDYFVLYVSPQFKGNAEALSEAAKKLSPKDVADILSAYEKRLQAPEVYGAKDATNAIDGNMGGEPLPSPNGPAPEPPAL